MDVLFIISLAMMILWCLYIINDMIRELKDYPYFNDFGTKVALIIVIIIHSIAVIVLAYIALSIIVQY